MFIHEFRRIGPFIATCFVLLVIAGFSLSVRAWRHARESSSNSAGSVSLKRQRGIAEMTSEVITITPHGFEPSSLTIPHEKFQLLVDNRSGIANTSLQIVRDNGAREHDMKVPREEPNWSEVINLAPGRYSLIESNHPRWSCRITVTN